MLCRQERPQALLSPYVPRYIGLLNGLYIFLSRALVRFLGQKGKRLYLVIDRATNWISCQDAVGEAALKTVKLQTGPLALALPACLSAPGLPRSFI